MVKEYKLPLYKGNETEYEDIIYSFFRKIGEDFNFIFKAKKTNTKIDEILYSKGGNTGRGSSDGYLFANLEENKPDNFIGFIELESNNKMNLGIEQIKQYSKSVKDNWNNFFKEQEYFLSIVYDGIKIFLKREYSDKTETIIDNLEVSKNHVGITKKLMEEIINLIPKDNKLDFEDNEKKLIKSFKEKIRNNGTEIKKNRSELMTVLSSIYSIIHNNKLRESIEEIKKSKTEIDTKIYNSWKNISGKIEYEKKTTLIQELYEEIAIPMSLIAQTKDIDLYGYFYEELSEKESKQEGGEFYTPRHIIKPIVKYVFNNILRWERDELLNKKVGDIFVGSGGFLYEYLKYLHRKYNLKNEQIDEIAKRSCYGCDNSGVESAQLNMYLVGDGNVNLDYVKTSLNWRKAYLLAKDKLKNEQFSYRQSLNFFIKIYLTDKQLKILENKKILDKERNLTDNAIKQILEKENNLYKYNSFEEFLKENLDFGEDDKNQKILGDLDLLFTNVPYGSIKNKEGKKYWVHKGYPARLETNSLKECIDLLKPKSNRNEGGVGVIIVPSGILETNENLKIRQYLIKNCDILGIISLPKYTFAPYTTQKTYILIIQKKSEKEIKYFELKDYSQKNKTFMYISDVDGKAQSDKRYEVNLMGEDKFGEVWLHNDFKENFGKYDGTYLSKIERCWDLFELNKDMNYNQKRITAKWNGNDWEKIEGNKWGGFQIKSFKKKFFKEKKIGLSLVKKLNLFLKNKKITYEEFLKDKKILGELENYKISNGKKGKLLFSSSDFDLIKEIFLTIFIKSDGKLCYLDKKEVFDFNISPENYLINKQKEDISLEDIKAQLESL